MARAKKILISIISHNHHKFLVKILSDLDCINIGQRFNFRIILTINTPEQKIDLNLTDNKLSNIVNRPLLAIPQHDHSRSMLHVSQGARRQVGVLHQEGGGTPEQATQDGVRSGRSQNHRQERHLLLGQLQGKDHGRSQDHQDLLQAPHVGARRFDRFIVD